MASQRVIAKSTADLLSRIVDSLDAKHTEYMSAVVALKEWIRGRKTEGMRSGDDNPPPAFGTKMEF